MRSEGCEGVRVCEGMSDTERKKSTEIQSYNLPLVDAGCLYSRRAWKFMKAQACQALYQPTLYSVAFL